jgi:hypothetical protein
MDEPGFLHFPLPGLRRKALFPMNQEPIGNQQRMPNFSPPLNT